MQAQTHRTATTQPSPQGSQCQLATAGLESTLVSAVMEAMGLLLSAGKRDGHCLWDSTATSWGAQSPPRNDLLPTAVINSPVHPQEDGKHQLSMLCFKEPISFQGLSPLCSLGFSIKTCWLIDEHQMYSVISTQGCWRFSGCHQAWKLKLCNITRKKQDLEAPSSHEVN